MQKRMTLLDASFIAGERRTSPQHGAILLIFKQPDGAPDDYLQREAERVRGYPVTAEPFNYLLTRGVGRLLAPSWTVLHGGDRARLSLPALGTASARWRA